MLTNDSGTIGGLVAPLAILRSHSPNGCPIKVSNEINLRDQLERLTRLELFETRSYDGIRRDGTDLGVRKPINDHTSGRRLR